MNLTTFIQETGAMLTASPVCGRLLEVSVELAILIIFCGPIRFSTTQYS